MAKPKRICSIEGCCKNHLGHGFCRSHYKRFIKHGDPLGGGPSRESGVGCSVQECERPFYSKGYCDLHYKRWSLKGDPGSARVLIAGDGEPEAFYRNVVLQYDGNECLIWPFGKSGNGYGSFNLGGTRGSVHRKVCEEVYGRPPTHNHEAAHSCGNGHGGCVAKRHLSWKTTAENQADRVQHDTHRRGERSHFAKLTEIEVREILSLKGTETNSAIARRYGVSQPTISEIQSGKSWSWLHE
jgi:hypothetical protein